MNLMKYNSGQVLKFYMFWQRGAILRDFFMTEEQKPSTLL